MSMIIDADFPGGNIIVERIEGTSAWVYQDLRDTAVDWFYWYLRVRGAAGHTITIHFTRSHALGVRGPGVSFDAGRTWHWLWQEPNPNQKQFTCAIPAGAEDARFSFGMPYLQDNLHEFLRRRDYTKHLSQAVLCQTAKGRSAEFIRVGRLDGKAKSRVLVTCRHHACEMMASYSLEGMIDAVLGHQHEWLRENVEFIVVPFMDKDGVEDGDQGKSRRPHDHNRDYGTNCIHPTVKALKNLASNWHGEPATLAIDLHCPWIHGTRNKAIYFVAEADPLVWARTEEFSRVLAEVQTGPLRFHPTDNLPFGESWNTHSGPDWTFACWSSRLPGAIFGTTIEIPYANAHGIIVDAESSRAFGRDLALALEVYLRRRRQAAGPTTAG